MILQNLVFPLQQKTGIVCSCRGRIVIIFLKKTENLDFLPEQVMACTAASVEERHVRLKLVRFEQAYHKTDDLF
jgi:hypothetical protein